MKCTIQQHHQMYDTYDTTQQHHQMYDTAEMQRPKSTKSTTNTISIPKKSQKNLVDAKASESSKPTYSLESPTQISPIQYNTIQSNTIQTKAHHACDSERTSRQTGRQRSGRMRKSWSTSTAESYLPCMIRQTLSGKPFIPLQRDTPTHHRPIFQGYLPYWTVQSGLYIDEDEDELILPAVILPMRVP